MRQIEISIPRFIPPIVEKMKNGEELTMNEKILWDHFDCDLDFAEDQQFSKPSIPFEF